MTHRGRLAFATMCLLWGIPYLFIKVAVDGGVGPVFLAWSRVTIAAAILLAFAWRAGVLQALRGHGRWLAIFATCEIAIPFPMLAVGEQHVASSLAAILIATVPLIVAVLAIRFAPAERVAGRRLVGLFIGLAGVVVLMGIDVAGSTSELIGAAAIMVTALGYSIGPLILNRHLVDIDPRATMGAALAIAAVILTPLAAIDAPGRAPSTSALVALVVLAVVCTALAFVVFTVLIGEVGPSRATVFTYVNPVVAVALGVIVLGERPGPGALFGLLAIIAGSWLATGRSSADPVPDLDLDPVDTGIEAEQALGAQRVG
jgi:drug/metabolite transporter (DMT)-like permease